MKHVLFAVAAAFSIVGCAAQGADVASEDLGLQESALVDTVTFPVTFEVPTCEGELITMSGEFRWTTGAVVNANGVRLLDSSNARASRVWIRWVAATWA